MSIPHFLRAALFALCLVSSGATQAAELQPGEMVRIPTRGVVVPIYALWRDDAVATLVLYSGAGGGIGRLGRDGWPDSRNFLIRSAQRFAAHPFNLVMVDVASDMPQLSATERIGEAHEEDNRAIFRAIKARSAQPIWIVGTSMGTISATAIAVHDAARDIAGLVLTSSVTAARVPGSVPSQDLSRIVVPVLIVHHAHDACRTCVPQEAALIEDALNNAPIKKTMLVDGGSGESGDACGPLQHHGFIGIEDEVVERISEWIIHPMP